MAIQLSAAKESLKRLKRDIQDIDDVSGTFIEWCNFANRQIYNYLCGIIVDQFVATETYTNSISGSYALPTDLLSFRGLDLGFFLQNPDGSASARRLPVTGYGSTQNGYYLDRNNVVFTGTPNPTTYVLRYLPKPTTFTAENQYFTLDGTETGIEIIPDFYLEALRDDLARFYSQWDEDLGMESVSDFRFSRTLSDMQQFIKRNPRAKSTPSYSSAY